MAPHESPIDDAPAVTARHEARADVAAPSPDALHVVLPAVEVTASVARGLVGRWLAAMAWPAAQRDDIVLAVNEAVSNAIEHAYLQQPSLQIELDATVAASDRQRFVTVTVRDHGTWRPAPADDENRRRGIPMMRACMDTVAIATYTTPAGEPAGTLITLRSNPVPTPEDHNGVARTPPD